MIHSDGELFEDDALVARLIGYGIAAIITAVLLLVPLGVLAQTTPPLPEPACLPANGLIKGTGTDYKVFETSAMHGEVGWCPSTDGTTWHITFHRWCLKSICDKAPPDAITRLMAAVDRIRAAADPMAQMQIEWATAAIPLVTDLEKWQGLDFSYQACQWLSSTQPGVTPRPPLPLPFPKKLPTDVDILPPLNYCDVWKPGPRPLAPCAAQAVPWAGGIQGVPSCVANYAGGASGSVATLTNTNAPNTGTATASCTDGVLAITATTCVAPPPPTTVYVVTPNGTSPTRQYFIALQQPDGSWKRSTSPAGTTPVGGTCDCAAVSILEFNITRYCKVPAPTITAVAACMVKK